MYHSVSRGDLICCNHGEGGRIYAPCSQAVWQSISYYIQIRKMVIHPIKQQVIEMTYTYEEVRAENMRQGNAHSLREFSCDSILWCIFINQGSKTVNGNVREISYILTECGGQGRRFYPWQNSDWGYSLLLAPLICPCVGYVSGPRYHDGIVTDP
jgi:hypothetical protein